MLLPYKVRTLCSSPRHSLTPSRPQLLRAMQQYKKEVIDLADEENNMMILLGDMNDSNFCQWASDKHGLQTVLTDVVDTILDVIQYLSEYTIKGAVGE